jgi:hypothetical protein
MSTEPGDGPEGVRPTPADDTLLAELGTALREAAEVPAHFLAAGRAAFTWQRVDAELAQLQHDSATEAAGERSGVRAQEPPTRLLTFAAGEFTLEVEVTPSGLQGQVVPPGAGRIELQQPEHPAVAVPVDEVGWFAFAVRPAGLFRLQWTADSQAVLTAWTRL